MFYLLIRLALLALVSGWTTAMKMQDYQPTPQENASIPGDEKDERPPWDISEKDKQWSNYFFYCDNITIERLDPIDFPGIVSPHTHMAFGGSAFAPALPPGKPISTCTSCEVANDGSIYWVPLLYVKDNGEYRAVEQEFIKVYYQ